MADQGEQEHLEEGYEQEGYEEEIPVDGAQQGGEQEVRRRRAAQGYTDRAAMAFCIRVCDGPLRMRASVPPLLLQALDEMKRKLKELEDEAIRLKQAVQVRNLAAPQTRRALLAPHKAYATVRDACQEQAEV